MFGHKLHIGTPYRGNRFWTRQIPTSCLPTLLIFIHIEHICSFVVAFFSATIDCRNLIFGHKLHIDTPYRGNRFWTHQIPTSCLPTLLIFIHIEHTFCICPFLVAFFSATIDGRNLIFGYKLHIGTPYHGKWFFCVFVCFDQPIFWFLLLCDKIMITSLLFGFGTRMFQKMIN